MNARSRSSSVRDLQLLERERASSRRFQDGGGGSGGGGDGGGDGNTELASGPSDTRAARPARMRGRHLYIGSYVLGEKIGEGATSTVHRAMHKATRQVVAIKTVNKRALGADVLARVYQEISMLEHLRHPNVIKLIDVVDDPKALHIVMEYCSGGEIFSLVGEQGPMREDYARHLIAQVVSALCYCHAEHIAHRDLKLENMLLSARDPSVAVPQWVVKLTDFGFGAYVLTEDGQRNRLSAGVGTLYYAAPEVIFNEGEGYDGPPVDVWSLGVCLYCLVMGGAPFDGPTIEVVLERIRTAAYAPFSAQVSLDCQDLIVRMFELDATKRITMPQIRDHRWMAVKTAPASSRRHRREVSPSAGGAGVPPSSSRRTPRSKRVLPLATAPGVEPLSIPSHARGSPVATRGLVVAGIDSGADADACVGVGVGAGASAAAAVALAEVSPLSPASRSDTTSIFSTATDSTRPVKPLGSAPIAIQTAAARESAAASPGSRAGTRRGSRGDGRRGGVSSACDADGDDTPPSPGGAISLSGSTLTATLPGDTYSAPSSPLASLRTGGSPESGSLMGTPDSRADDLSLYVPPHLLERAASLASLHDSALQFAEISESEEELFENRSWTMSSLSSSTSDDNQCAAAARRRRHHHHHHHSHAPKRKGGSWSSSSFVSESSSDQRRRHHHRRTHHANGSWSSSSWLSGEVLDATAHHQHHRHHRASARARAERESLSSDISSSPDCAPLGARAAQAILAAADAVVPGAPAAGASAATTSSDGRLVLPPRANHASSSSGSNSRLHSPGFSESVSDG